MFFNGNMKAPDYLSSFYS